MTMSMSLNSHSLPVVQVGRPSMAECQLCHIVLVGLPRWQDDLLLHSNMLMGCSTVPATLVVLGVDCWVGIWGLVTGKIVQGQSVAVLLWDSGE